LLEFQRRSGDLTAFVKLYRRSSAYLQGPAYYSAALDSDKLPEILQMVPLPPDQAIAPLVDMAECSEDISILTEVASALAVMAEDPEVAAQLLMPCAFSVMQQIQRANEFGVAFPASRLPSHI